VPVIHVWNKTDMAAADVQSRHTAQLNAEQIALSARTGDGLDALRKRLLEVAGWQSAPEGLYLARARHVEALQAGCPSGDGRRAVGGAIRPSGPAGRRAALAQLSLNSITGEFSSDDLLGVIFSSFCIGK
jgi:tRNA modification GTPase